MKNKSYRLTTGQALVRYLGRQYVERDGKRNRFIEGILGGVTVVVVPVDPEKRMPGMGTWWDVPVAEVSAEEKTRKTRERYEEATSSQRPLFV